jgi:single-strand DNA-binding protein
MAEGLNKVLLIGNLGQQPELRTTQSGQSVMTLRMATNERYKNRDGVWTDRAEWHTVVVWGKRAEGLSKVVSKGTQLFIEGKLQTRSWDDQQGQKRYTTEVVARQVLLLGGRGGGSSSNSGAPPPGDNDYGGSYGGSYGGGGDDFTEDDIPF